MPPPAILDAPTLDLAPLLAELEEKGAEFSAKNRSDITAHLNAIAAIVNRAQPADDDDEDDDEDPPSGAAESASPAAPSPLLALAEAASLGAGLEANLHSNLVRMVDELYGGGFVSREELAHLLTAVSASVDAFAGHLQDAFPAAYLRDTLDGPADAPVATSEATKTEDGQAFPASDYAYVPDPDLPSTWKLRLTSSPGGAPDPRIVGAAAAALGPGFRGQRVQIPAADLPRVKARVRAAWRRANPDKDDADMPSGIKEAQLREILGDEVPFAETAEMVESTANLLIIRPGWGSSGYYPAKVLERDGPRVFTKGTHMHWNHPSATERRERPERDVLTLAATLAEDAVYRKDGPAGEGLYGTADVLSQSAPLLKELAPHIGTSVYGTGKGAPGVREGRRGFVFDELTEGRSVDLVTHAGAGGRVLEVLEAARARASASPPPKEDTMRDPIPDPPAGQSDDIFAEVAQLREAQAAADRELSQHRTWRLQREAADVVSEVLSQRRMPPPSRTRVAESLNPAAYATPEGTLDRERFTTAVNEAAEAEASYLQAVYQRMGGISGMGGGALPTVESSAEAADKALRDQLRRSMPNLPESAIDYAMGHR